MTAEENEVASTSRRRRRLPAAVDGLTVGLVILAVWEIGARVGGVPAYLLPAPSAIAVRLFNDWRSIAFHTAVTTSEILIGFLLSIVISIPLAAVLAQFRPVERALYPVLVASQTVPKVAIAPLLVVWFGFGLEPKIIIAFLVCFFPIVIDAMIGFRSTPKEVLWLARSMGTSRWKTFVHFQIPAALPNIFAGVKVASTLAVVGAVVGEFVAADRGLGYQLIVANGTLDVGLSFAILVTLSVLGIVIFAIIDLLERLALPWHVSQRVMLPPASGSS
jgi:NitT/TauT family transport system permease protein